MRGNLDCRRPSGGVPSRGRRSAARVGDEESTSSGFYSWLRTASRTRKSPNRLQPPHLANIARLHRGGEDHSRGAILDRRTFRGVFFSSSSSRWRRRRPLATTDPAIQAGFLRGRAPPVGTREGDSGSCRKPFSSEVGSRDRRLLTLRSTKFRGWGRWLNPGAPCLLETSTQSGPARQFPTASSQF